MLGDIGGVSSIFISAFSILLNPLIKFNFKFAYFRKLYKSSLKSNNLLKSTFNNNSFSEISVSLFD